MKSNADYPFAAFKRLIDEHAEVVRVGVQEEADTSPCAKSGSFACALNVFYDDFTDQELEAATVMMLRMTHYFCSPPSVAELRSTVNEMLVHMFIERKKRNLPELGPVVANADTSDWPELISESEQ